VFLSKGGSYSEDSGAYPPCQNKNCGWGPVALLEFWTRGDLAERGPLATAGGPPYNTQEKHEK